MSLTGRGSAEGWGGAGGGGSREPAAKRAGFIAGSASAPEGAEGIPTRAFFSFIFGEDQSLLSAKRRHAARAKTKGRDRDRFGVVADPEYSHRATLGAPDDPRERGRSRRARIREEARVEVEARAPEIGRPGGSCLVVQGGELRARRSSEISSSSAEHECVHRDSSLRGARARDWRATVTANRRRVRAR